MHRKIRSQRVIAEIDSAVSTLQFGWDWGMDFAGVDGVTRYYADSRAEAEAIPDEVAREAALVYATEVERAFEKAVEALQEAREALEAGAAPEAVLYLVERAQSWEAEIGDPWVTRAVTEAIEEE